jgi:hypothetical protein
MSIISVQSTAGGKAYLYGHSSGAVSTFLKGIGMPTVFVLLLPLFPGWRTMKALAPTLAYDIALTQDMPPVERATQFSVSTQIIVGGKSPAAIHNVGRQLMKAIPNAKFAQLAGKDHMVNAKVLLPLLSGFLNMIHPREVDTTPNGDL